jgi:hypothetical protein
MRIRCRAARRPTPPRRPGRGGRQPRREHAPPASGQSKTTSHGPTRLGRQGSGRGLRSSQPVEPQRPTVAWRRRCWPAMTRRPPTPPTPRGRRTRRPGAGTRPASTRRTRRRSAQPTVPRQTRYPAASGPQDASTPRPGPTPRGCPGPTLRSSSAWWRLWQFPERDRPDALARHHQPADAGACPGRPNVRDLARPGDAGDKTSH